MTTPPARRARAENGQVSTLILGLTVIILGLVLAVIDVTAVQLARARLFDVCDAAALDAADEISLAGVYTEGLRSAVPVTDETVRGAAAAFLAAQEPPHDVAAWQLTSGTGTPDGRSARVVLTAKVEMPLANGFLEAINGAVTLTVESTATARIDALVPSGAVGP